METLCILRKISENGRIILPLKVRKMLNWQKEMILEVYYKPDSQGVFLKSHEPLCTYCGTTQNLLLFKNQYVCRSCQGEIAKLCVK